MYSNDKSGKKRQSTDFYNETPTKKIVSYADTFIKSLSHKQLEVETTLKRELAKEKHFVKKSEFVPLTNYAAGTKSLVEFESISRNCDEVETFKSMGLTADDIALYKDYKDNSLKRHKNVDKSVLENRLESILRMIEENKKTELKEDNVSRLSRQENEELLSTKPNSVETKLLEFAVRNQNGYKEKLPHPMDDIKSIEQDLILNHTPIDIKKIRKKARSLQHKIDTITVDRIEPLKPSRSNFLRSKDSKWDKKEAPMDHKETPKTYTCKPQNLYTIRDGKIVKINPPKT